LRLRARKDQAMGGVEKDYGFIERPHNGDVTSIKVKGV